MGRIGCLFALPALALLAMEAWVFSIVAGWLGAALGGGREWFGTALLVLLMTVVGVKLLRWRIGRLPIAFLSGDAGSACIGILGAVLVVFPGFATTIVGLLLQIPLFQRAFGALGRRLLQVFTALAMKRMGQFPPGAFPGGFPFPGMPAGGRGPFGGSGKTRDTTAERVDKKD